MNHYVPDWTNMGDTSRPLGEDDDLIELLWCNGHVVMQSQTNRKLPPRPEKAAAAAAAPPPPAAPSVPQEDEAGLWFPFALADSLDKDIFSDFFCEAPAPAPGPAPAAAAAAVAPVVASGGGGSVAVEAEAGKPRGGPPVAVEDVRRGAGAVPEAPPCDLMPPPKSTPASCSRQQTMSLADGGDNAGDLSDLVRPGGSAGKSATAAGGASSMLSAIGSSICGSNQVLVPRAVGAPGGRASGGSAALPSAMGSANANASGGRGGNETTVASSSGRSNCCFGTTTTTTTTTGTEPTSTSNRSSKRKRLDTEDSESPSEVNISHSEPAPPCDPCPCACAVLEIELTANATKPWQDAESESAAMLARKPPLKLTTARRSRAAEVHNLSERVRVTRFNFGASSSLTVSDMDVSVRCRCLQRRRDRINEKMRALQELIPHCNKTDKASMLDEAIEYLKSLQLQVQMMWMGGGIGAPQVVFPGVGVPPQYLSRMGVGMGAAAAAMSSMPQLPFVPPHAQQVVPNPTVNPVPLSPGYRSHMAPPMGMAAEPYAHYLGVNHLQPTPSQVHQHYAQGVGYYPPLGTTKAMQQNPALHHVPDGTMSGGVPVPPGVLPLPPESAPNRGPAGSVLLITASSNKFRDFL
ncbi:hypothetical protein U9M48_009981 [Paspalum notatum var. saurae]|uniref:BHLH domain-containing protein n=1 Tax=Paspalum notatum var. saurae TaxID=547442 RepID=A0AAQ3WG11_PASNO